MINWPLSCATEGEGGWSNGWIDSYDRIAVIIVVGVGCFALLLQVVGECQTCG